MYHGFSEQLRPADPHALFVPRAHLVQQLTHLRAAGWQPLDLDGFLRHLDGRPTRSRHVLVTIDDGYRSVLHIAAPEFRRAGVRPLLFVSPGLIAEPPPDLPVNLGDEPLVSIDELRLLLDTGVEVGVHGLDHTTMAGMTERELVRQTVDARACLADLTGIAARAFAYPLGVLDPRAAAAVRGAGYEVAFSVDEDAGRWGVPRTGVASVDALSAFRLKLSPWYDLAWHASAPLAGLRRHLRPALALADRSRARTR